MEELAAEFSKITVIFVFLGGYEWSMSDNGSDSPVRTHSWELVEIRAGRHRHGERDV